MDILGKINILSSQRGWSLNHLSKKAGLAQSTLSGLYRRNNYPTIPTLEKMCEAFGITMSEFFAQDNKLIELTAEQRELLDQWEKLSDKHKTAVIDLIRNL